MSHYVWLMNDGRWHISRQTNSTQPRLICEMRGSYDTRAAAQAALDAERPTVRLVATTDKEGQLAYYTGCVGRDWLSLKRCDAFAYVTDEGAERKATTLTDLTGLHFTVHPLVWSVPIPSAFGLSEPHATEARRLLAKAGA